MPIFPITQKVYKAPSITSFEPIAAVPALAAPLAFMSASSAATFVGGAVAGVAAAVVASKALGNVDMKHKLKAIIPVEIK